MSRRDALEAKLDRIIGKTGGPANAANAMGLVAEVAEAMKDMVRPRGMSDSMDFAFLRGRIVTQRRRINNRLKASSDPRWPISDDDAAELEAIDALLVEIEEASRSVQAAFSEARSS